MTCSTFGLPNLEQLGPVIETIITPSSAFLKSIEQEEERRKYMQGKPAKLLIDTGASSSAIDKSIATMLGLQPHGAINIATPSHTNHEVPVYDVDILLPTNRFHHRNIQVIASEFGNQGIDGLLGRDVLKNMLLIYHGYNGQFTLAV